MKYLNIIILVSSFFFISCNNKEVKSFKPTTKLDLILKNKKLSKTYYEFRIENDRLQSRVEENESFLKFINNTSIDELIIFTKCDSPVVRCFAFKALVEKKYPKIREILFEHKNDNETVIEYSPPCLQFKMPVKNYMLNQLDPFSKTKYKFNKAEFLAIQERFIVE
jgi:hypothetical protein